MTITSAQLNDFCASLIEAEASAGTVRIYRRIAEGFAEWLKDGALTKEALIEWRDSLKGTAATVNVAVAAVNKLTDFLGCPELRLRHLKTQRKVFRSSERELTKREYERLVTTAEELGKERLARIIETLCVLGIRVSELRFITVEALEKREVTIHNKGKTRTIMLHAELRKKLKGYCRKMGIKKGPVFITRTGRPLTENQIRYEMKWLSGKAGVEASKVFPHNLRHLFAVTHYHQHKDIVRLADLLGHSSVNTTRIYLVTSGAEHQQELNAMGLVLPDRAA